MKTSELEGAALDWAVAKALGYESDCISDEWKYSTNWAQGGPIIERERIQVSPGLPHDDHPWSAVLYDYMFVEDMDCWMGGPTPLIAAMRCYVASKLGDEVNIPEEMK
jgi:hypothetical protein